MQKGVSYLKQTYKFSEVIEVMEFGEMAIMVDSNNHKPYKGVGTVIYFDGKNDGALKYLHSGNDVVVCKTNSDVSDVWIIVDKK